MKKNLIITVIAVLIFTHIIPPYNISFANEEVNQCENMDFTVQKIIENDKKIVGTGLSSDQLRVEFKTKNKTEVVNVNSSGKFELKVEEEFLETNDAITISNEYFKVETKVAMEDESSTITIQSNQYGECPKENNLDNEALSTESEEELDNEASSTEPEEELDNEAPSTESVEELDNEASSTESEEELDNEASSTESEEELDNEAALNESDEMFSTKSNIVQGLLNVDLFEDAKLEIDDSIDGEITLVYTGTSLLNISLLTDIRAIFYLPPEIINEIDQTKLKGSYSVPGLLGIGRVYKDLNSEDIGVEGNYIYMNAPNRALLNATSKDYVFTLTFEIGSLPPTQDEEYIFHAYTSNNIIDLNIISTDKRVKAKINAPGTSLTFNNVPESISFETTKIKFSPEKIRIPRQNPDWSIKVADTRGSSSGFRVFAEIDEPLSSNSSSHTLPEGLVYVDGNLESEPLSEKAVEVYSGFTGDEVNHEITWPKNQGIMVEVNPMLVRAETYSTTINWTLTDGPQ